MFSARVSRWSLLPNRLTDRLAQLRASGAAIFDLTESNPTRAGFAYPEDEVRAALSGPHSLTYEPHPRGCADARAAVAAYYGARGVAVDPDRVVLTASTSEAYGFLFKLLADPGQAILTPQPSYPLFEFLAGLESLEVRTYPLGYQGGWHLDLDALAGAARAPDVRAILVVSPGNPTGCFLKAPELAALRALERPLIVDEVFADYAAGPDPARVATVAGETGVLAFALSGLSKVCGLPQLKLGWIVVSGPDRARAAALERLDLIADTYLSVGTPVQAAAPRLLALAPALQEQIRMRLAKNHATCRHALQGTPAQLLEAEGGWSAIVRLPRTRTEEEWALALLEQDHVLAHPGYFFDFPEEAFLVVSLLTPEATLAAGLELLARRVAE